ncbi:MAG: class I SAM-dependent RNA methyltransferase [Brevinematales bacterium]|nr:class I SAM-dependent RNA methyltransferase [Brevinematales bacterium]
MDRGDVITIKILDIEKEGLCRGVSDKDVEVFTRYAIPGEIVNVKIFKFSPIYGDIVSILKPSEERVDPGCKFFGNCGGCDLQMLPYQKQLEYKKSLLIKEFSTLPYFNIEIIEDVVPSPKEYNYRNSVMFRVNPKHKKIGFLRRDTNIVVDIDECKIASEEINYALKKIRQQENFPPHVFKVRSTSDGDIVVNQIKTQNFEDRDVFETVIVDGLSYKFRISRESFFQVNNYVIPIWLKKIRELVLENLEDRSLVLDLYCGVGLITFFVSDLFDRVIGVEISKRAVEDAIFNITLNNIKNVEIIRGEVSKVIPIVNLIPEFIIVDPSREGIDSDTMNFIISYYKQKGKPRKILYSSCNYETQVRDIRKLYEYGFRVKKVVPFDMFPQTHHVEVLAYIEVV